MVDGFEQDDLGVDLVSFHVGTLFDAIETSVLVVLVLDANL